MTIIISILTGDYHVEGVNVSDKPLRMLTTGSPSENFGIFTVFGSHFIAIQLFVWLNSEPKNILNKNLPGRQNIYLPQRLINVISVMFTDNSVTPVLREN